MTSPIDIDDLTETFAIDPVHDLMITENEPEQATTRATVKQVQSIAINNLAPLPMPYTSGDVFVVREESTGDNKSVAYSDITLPTGTRLWIYAASPPSGWKIVADTGDRLLALAGGSLDYNVAGGSPGGTWVSSSVNGNGSALTPQQMPPHSHRTQKRAHAEDFFINQLPARMGKKVEDDFFPSKRYCFTEFEGGSATHNHGDAWRPRAYVGVLVEKI